MKRVSETAKNLSAAGFVLFAKTDLPGNKFNPVPLGMPGIVITDVQDSFVRMEPVIYLHHRECTLSGVFRLVLFGNLS